MKLIIALLLGLAATASGPANGGTVSHHQNKLAEETSPYLLQHASNPVDWYPWGPEALQKAKSENKPIFLSIGYSSCHWCHVMEHESFENDSIAAIMNEYFVSIKVDREERPDLDDFYMTFVQMTTGSGGWPMSVFLTPNGTPFFGGTYFPPQDAYGRRGFPSILMAVANTWAEKRDQVEESAASLLGSLQQQLAQPATFDSLPENILANVTDQMLARFDSVNGGFGGAPKFPPSYALSLLMKQYSRSHDQRILTAVTKTLDKMAAGGMYDQLGGGFHRYSVDSLWLVPHFEKMLYDNALVAATYFEGFQLTGNPTYRRIGFEILDYVLRDLSDSAGGFQSSEDADSEGEEGKFYVWTPQEVIDALGSEDGKLFCDYFDVTNAGNFEGNRSILHVRVDPEQFAESYKLTPEQLATKLDLLRARLLAVRYHRVRPNRDDKVLTEWNGLMLSSLAKGYQATGINRYLHAAEHCARFIETTMIGKDGLRRVYRQGQVKQHGFLTDYAFTINGLIDLYEASFDIHWLETSRRLADEMIAKFSDSANGGFYMTDLGQTDLPLRQKDSYDGATPSGNSATAISLLRLSTFFDNRQYYDLAERTIASLAKTARQAPAAFMNLLNAYDFIRYRPCEIAIVGRHGDPATQALIKTARSTYQPERIIAFLDPDDPKSTEAVKLIPLLKDRPMADGKAQAFVCRNFACKLPAHDPQQLSHQLKADTTDSK